MQLGQDVAADTEHEVAAAVEVQLDVVLPLDLVADMVLVTPHRRIVNVELLVRVAEWQCADFVVQSRSARITAVLVTERATRHRIHWRMPRGIQQTVGAYCRVTIVVGFRARVTRPRCPQAIRYARTDRLRLFRRTVT